MLNSGMQYNSDDISQANAARIERIEAMQYNLAVQRGDSYSAFGSLIRMTGQWLANRFGQ